MYVRWQCKYDRKRKTYGRGYYGAKAEWYAVLVESRRIDGKPRQRHIAYLGSALSLDNQTDLYRVYWWNEIKARLDQLGNVIPAEQRLGIEAALAKKVPTPPPDFKWTENSSADLHAILGTGAGQTTFMAALTGD